jgi:AraC family transcriptional regulator
MPEIKRFPETHVAYVSEVGPYGEAVQRGFKRLFDWLSANHIQPVGPSMGIYYDDPAKVAPENLRSDLCVPVGPDVTGSGEVQTKEIGGWQVAALVYQGQENIARAYNEVYDWLHSKGYHELDAPVEVYLSRLGEELRAEIDVPITKKELLPGQQKASERGRPKQSTRKSTAKTPRKSSRRAPKS